MVTLFPDVIVSPSGEARIITEDGLMWMRWNTAIRATERGNWPLSQEVIDQMEKDGIIVHRNLPVRN